MRQAYRFALDPNDMQAEAFASHCGAARHAFNWAIRQVKANLGQREAERSYGVAEADLIPSLSWTHFSLKKVFNQDKHTVCVNKDGEPWHQNNSKWAADGGTEDAAKALKNFSDSKSGKRKGPKMGFPRIKKKGRCRTSCRFADCVEVKDLRHISFPRIGLVRTHESTWRLLSLIEVGEAETKSATLSQDAAGHWFVSISVEMPDIRPLGQSDEVVGIDLGLKILAVVTTASGRVVHTEPNNRHLKTSLTRLRRYQRKLSRSQPKSKRHEVFKKRVGKLHVRVANQRNDQIHKLTTMLAERFTTVVVEDLNVKGMIRNRRMARAVSDAGFAEIRRQLSYKCESVIIADRWFASSRTCSACGWQKPSLTLADRTFICENCGLMIDRDVNAAINLAKYSDTAAGYAVAGRGRCIRPGLAQAAADETSTVSDGTRGGDTGERSCLGMSRND